MAFCMRCGAQLPDGSAFCNNCGTAQGQQNTQAAQGAGAPQMPPQMQQQAQMQQPPQFGQQPQSYGQQPQYGQAPPAGGNGGGNRGLVIGLVVGVVALVAVIAVLAVVLLTRDRVTDTGATTARTRAGRSRTDTGTEITQDEGEISPLSVVCTDYAWELTLENDEGEDMVYDIHYITPGVTDEAYPALQKSLDQFAQQQREALRNDILLQSQDL